MENQIYTFSLNLTMGLMADIRKIDRFDASWETIEKRERMVLKHLKEIATVRSTGASTRIEGSKMSDTEVEALISRLQIARLEERDEQEVAGYFEVLDTVFAHWKNIDLNEGNLKNLHNLLMKHSEQDSWHKGNYKQASNAVEATYPDGSKRIIFKTAEPGYETEDAMKKLLEWYYRDQETLPLLKVPLFVYDFLSIHPFQDGNGRLSRLLTSLLLLKHGYSWIQYVSFEHEIESRKAEYYNVLMQTQKQRPNENADEWVKFFLSCLLNIQDQLIEKLQAANKAVQLAPKEKNILAYVENHPGSQSGEIAKALNMALPTVKKILSTMVEKKLISKSGAGAGVHYLAEERVPYKAERKFELSDKVRRKEFYFTGVNSFIEIKKIILTPLFQWSRPDEWAGRLLIQNPGFRISCHLSRNNHLSQAFAFSSFVNPYHYKPEFELLPPLNIPNHFTDGSPAIHDFPIRAEIELLSPEAHPDFDVMFVYNEAG